MIGSIHSIPHMAYWAMSITQPTTEEFLSQRDEDRAAIEKAFFSQVVLANRTVKTTWDRRLDDLNAAALPLLKEIAAGPLNIMDVAISSGVSTAEWYEYLVAHEIQFNLVGTDSNLHATLHSTRNLALLMDEHDHLIHFDLFGNGWPPYQGGLHLHMLRHWIAVTGVAIARSFGARVKKQDIQLVSHIIQGNNFSLRQDDLLQPNPGELKGAFTVVRAANILNYAYFKEDALRKILVNLKERLTPAGILIVCRTVEMANQGTIFQLENSRLIPRIRLGEGSEIESLAVRL